MRFNVFIFLLSYCLSRFSNGAPADDLNCLQVVCNFEQEGLCGYENARSEGNNEIGIGTNAVVANQQWKLSQGMQKNRATGVRKPGEGSFYASTYLMQNDVAILISQGRLQNSDIRFIFPLVQDRVIRFKYYKVTTGIILKGCCDSINNCPYSTEKLAIITDFDKWKTASFLCRAGTEKIIFYGSNEGRNEGGIGLDDIQMFYPTGDNVDEAQENSCSNFDNSINRQSDLLNLMMNSPITESGSELSNSSESKSSSSSSVIALNGTLLTIMQKPKGQINDSHTSKIDKDNNVDAEHKSSTEDVSDLSTVSSSVATVSSKDDFVLVLIPSNLSLSNTKSDQLSRISRFRRSRDFEKSILKDSFVLSSRLYLAPNETASKLQQQEQRQQQQQTGFVNTLNVGGLKIEDLPSGDANNRNVDDEENS